MKTTSIIIGGILLFSLAACDGDEGKIYTSRDPDECKTLLFTCAPGRDPFFNNEGCGCELNGEEIDLNRDINRRNNDRGNIIAPENTYDRDPGLQNLDGENNDQRFDEDPLERDLDQQQERRLQND